MQVDHMDGQTVFESVPDGSVTTPAGFAAAGVHAGFRANPTRLDLAIVAADEPACAAAVFTRNEFCAAPVVRCRARLEQSGGYWGCARAVVVNSGVANAATGAEGERRAERMAHIAADALGCPADEVLVASTGVIGVQLPLEPCEAGIPQAVAALARSGGHDAACAIMTTDTHPKECAVALDGAALGFPGRTFFVGGMAKGSGMIMPNMATMISVITTDVPLAPPDARFALKRAADASFNKVTVDSDTSTNDTCILLSSGAGAGLDPLSRESAAFAVFEQALRAVCVTLARAMARDGEGATRLITVNVEGAATEEDADRAARSIANSPLVKTAVFGRDANWGRIAAALGKSGARFDQARVDIDIMGIPVCAHGLALAFDEDEARTRFEDPEIAIDVRLGAGDASATVWTCDLTHDYVSINADYRS